MSESQVAALRHELAEIEQRPGMEERVAAVKAELDALKKQTRAAYGAGVETTAAPRVANK